MANTDQTPDKERGLYPKYIVGKIDEMNEYEQGQFSAFAGEDFKFVLSPEKDVMSRQALRTYATWCLIQGWDVLGEELIAYLEKLDEEKPLDYNN